MRPGSRTAGRVAGSIAASRASDALLKSAARRSGNTPDRSRTTPALSSMPGFYMPFWPYRSNFIDFFSLQKFSVGPAAVDDMRSAGGENGFVGGEIYGQRGNLVRLAQASHRLTRHECARHLIDVLAALARLRFDALLE